MQELERSYVKPSMLVTFNDEPKPRPLTGNDCFKAYLSSKGVDDKDRKFSMLDPHYKLVLINAAKNNVKLYKNAIKSFVSALSNEHRRIYIGQNRLKFIKLFGATDIFENDYPCSEYPPFQPTTAGKSKRMLLDESDQELLHNLAHDNSVEDSDPLASSTPAVVKKSQGSDSDNDSDLSDQSEEVEIPQNHSRYVQIGQKSHNKRMQENDSSSSEESDEDDPAAEARTPAVTADGDSDSSSSGDSDDSSSDEEQTAKAAALVAAEDSDSDSDEDNLPPAWGQ